VFHIRFLSSAWAAAPQVVQGDTFFPVRKLRAAYAKEIFGPGNQIKFNPKQTL